MTQPPGGVPLGPGDPSAPPDPRWQLSLAGASAAVAGMALVLLGVLVGRADVAVLGVPLVLSVLWAWLRRPGAGATFGHGGLERTVTPGVVAHTLRIGPAPGVATVLLRVSAPGHRPGQALVGVAGPRTVRVSVTTARTGEREMFGTDHQQAGDGHVVKAEPGELPPVRLTVLPGRRPLRRLPLPDRLQGLTGPHDSRRAGDGGDLRDIDVFAPGDRLRRIDWRVTARRSTQVGLPGGGPQLGELYVRRTFATADATVMLVLDSRDDVGPDVATWGDATLVRPDEATSLDLAREAAASMARGYLDGGDRVGLEDLGRMQRPVAPAGGRHQLDRLVHRLARAQPEGEPKRRRRAPRVPSGALVVVYSTFLDDDAAALAQLWRHAGHRVVAVDVLPRLSTASLEPRTLTAFRIVRLERADRLRELSGSGVEVVHWESQDGYASAGGDGDPGTGGVEVALSALARRRRPRR